MVAAIPAMIEALAVMATEILKKLPTYDQKKKQVFFDLMKAYACEKVKPVHERDDDLILNMRDEILAFSLAFSKEIEGVK